MEIQIIITVLVIGAAAAYLSRKFYLSMKRFRKDEKICSPDKCSSCSLSGNCSDENVK